jgi:hypothetical protein
MDKLKILIELIKHFAGEAIIAVVENAALEAATHGEWSAGEKTKFVEAKARAAAAATPTPVDDLLLDFAIRYYDRRYNK